MNRQNHFVLFVSGSPAVSTALMAQAPQAPARDLTQASLEDLLSIQASSVSKKDQKLSSAAAVIPLQGGGTGIVKVQGVPNPQAEQLHDLEAGYRTQLTKRFSLDATLFLNHYRHLETSEPGTPYFVAGPAPYLLLPTYIGWKAHARTYGGEISAVWTASNRWKLTASYTQLRWTPLRHWEWDSSLAYTGRRHLEFIGYSPEVSTLSRRSLYGKVTWRF